MNCDKCKDTGQVLEGGVDSYYHPCDCALGKMLRRAQKAEERLEALEKAVSNFNRDLDEVDKWHE